METMSNLQLELLRLYGNGVSEENLREIKTASGLTTDVTQSYFKSRRR